MGENVTITLKEYNELKRCKEIVRYIEEEIHEELSVRPLTDKKALEKLKRLHGETKSGKRKTLSEEEFLAAAGA